MSPYRADGRFLRLPQAFVYHIRVVIRQLIRCIEAEQFSGIGDGIDQELDGADIECVGVLEVGDDHPLRFEAGERVVIKHCDFG